MKKTIQLCAVLMTMSVWIGAQSLFESAVSGESDTGVSSGLNFDLGGRISAGSIFSWEETEFMYNYAGLDLNAKVDKQGLGAAYADARVQIKNATPEFKLREAWVALYLGPLDIILGEQIISWGRADNINPTNHFGVMDTNELTLLDLDASKIGNLMARIKLNLAPLKFEILATPDYRYSTLPSSFDVNVAGTAEYKTPMFGAKIDLVTAPIEMAVSYFYGRTTESGLKPGTAGFSRVAARQQSVGFDFAAVPFNFIGVRGELAWSYLPEEDSDLPEVPNPELEWVVGLDKRIFSALNIVAQYYGKYIIDWKEADSGVPTAAAEKMNRILSGQTEQWQHGMNLMLQIDIFKETFHVEAIADLNFSTQDFRLMTRITYDITDAFVILGGFSLVYGPEDSRMDLMKSHYRNVFLETQIKF